MKSILRALALTGIVGFVAAAGAQAQTRVYVGFGSPVAAVVPPCPGDGYAWTAGYYEGRVWVPGRYGIVVGAASPGPRAQALGAPAPASAEINLV